MWKVIHIAHFKEEADRIEDFLKDEGILVKLVKIGKTNRSIYEIMVPESEAEDAVLLINKTNI